MTSTEATESVHSRISFYEDRRGILSWILTLDHKRIGLLYLIFVIGFFFSGVVLGFFMRLEMVAPGGTIMGPQTYNALFTLHGIIMIFLVVIPAIPTIFGNFFPSDSNRSEGRRLSENQPPFLVALYLRGDHRLFFSLHRRWTS